MSAYPITPDGHRKMMEELKHLKSVERMKIVDEIEIARAHGDLSENAEYEAAKDKQGLVNARILDLEDKLARSEIIDPAKMSGDKVVFGATVTLSDTDSGENLHYQLVGGYEADVKQNKISVDSPIAKSLIGKETGDLVKVITPKGSRELEILSVEYK